MKKNILQELLHTHDADAALLTFMPDIRWAIDFTGSNGMLVILPEESHFVTDGRYDVQAKQEVQEAQVHIPGYDLIKYIADEKLLDGAKNVLFQGDHVTVSDLSSWQVQMPDVVWQSVSELVTKQVAVKSEVEVEKMRRAQAVTDAVFEHLLGFIKPGMREQEIAAEIVYQHLSRGAERMSFDPIVASGPQSALPHARPTSKRIQPGEMIVLDMGCFVEGYASDMTRTIAIGEADDEARKVYNLVLDAQECAIDAARGGMASADLDNAARSVIKAGDYGDYFSHGLGHGVGLQIHEWPRVSYHVDYALPDGAVVTIEPGIYLPNRFGVRIEDLVVLRDDGCENLTVSPKALIVL